MVTLATVLICYGVCCKGELRRVAYIYLFFTLINIVVYGLFLHFEPAPFSHAYDLMYFYGVFESYIKITLLLYFFGFKHLWLIFCAIAHIINDGFNSFEYGSFNDLIIILEIVYILMGSKGVVAGFYKALPSGIMDRRFFAKDRL